MTEPLLDVRGLRKHFAVRRGILGGGAEKVHAVDGVSFRIARGETLALVGESGCGKSTVGRAVLRLVDVTEGEILFDGVRIDALSRAALRPLRRRFQVVFQDPFSSLNPRLRVRAILAEPLRNYRIAETDEALDRKVAELLEKVQLPAAAASKWPHEFSGGQRQRLCIARALATDPDLIVCDEAVSALDVSVKAQIVNLLQDLQRDLGLALLFISHDLAVVEHMAHRVAVMYLGRIVETGTRDEVFGSPAHPYTRALLSAVPRPDLHSSTARVVLQGDVASPIHRPTGCHFHPRCHLATELCRRDEPAQRAFGPHRSVTCHLA